VLSRFEFGKLAHEGRSDVHALTCSPDPKVVGSNPTPNSFLDLLGGLA
jgi:hypothetical protein